MRRALWSIPLLGAVACAGLLGLRKPAPHRFEHRAHVLQGIPCVKCHAGVATAVTGDPLHLPDGESCLECHEKPHDTRPCLTCHAGPYTAQDLMTAKEHLRFQHNVHRELTTKGRCVECHTGVKRDESTLRPTMGTCLGCHEHKDEFKVRDCDNCHVDLPTELTQPASHLVHDGDFLREHGARAASSADLCATCHRDSFCADCHARTVPALASTLLFDDPLRAGMHRAGFRSRHAFEARAEPGLCGTCHTQESCVRCHNENGVGAGAGDPRSPHPPGWVGVGQNEHGLAARRDPASCASCHGGAGEALCVQCHQVGGVGGNPHPPGWSSDRSMEQLPCRMCHTGPGTLRVPR